MAIPSQKRRTAGPYVSPKFVPGKGFVNPIALVGREQFTGSASNPKNPQKLVGMILGQGSINVSGTGTGNAFNGGNGFTVQIPLFGVQMPMTVRTPLAVMLFPTVVYGGYAQIFGAQAEVAHYTTQTKGQGPPVCVIPTGTTLQSLQASVTVFGRQPPSGTQASTISISVGGLLLSLLSIPEQAFGNSDLSVGSGTQVVPVVPPAT